MSQAQVPSLVVCTQERQESKRATYAVPWRTALRKPRLRQRSHVLPDFPPRPRPDVFLRPRISSKT